CTSGTPAAATAARARSLACCAPLSSAKTRVRVSCGVFALAIWVWAVALSFEIASRHGASDWQTVVTQVRGATAPSQAATEPTHTTAATAARARRMPETVRPGYVDCRASRHAGKAGVDRERRLWPAGDRRTAAG